MFLHVVLFIFLLCIFVMAIDQGQTDNPSENNQGDLQHLHPGERKIPLRGQGIIREQQKPNFYNLILTDSFSHIESNAQPGCSSFTAGSSEDLLNQNYIKLIKTDHHETDEHEKSAVLNCCNNHNESFVKLESDSIKNKRSLNLLKNINELNDMQLTKHRNLNVIPVYNNHMNVTNNITNKSQNSDDDNNNKMMKILITDENGTSEVGLNNLLKMSLSSLLFPKNYIGNSFVNDNRGNSDDHVRDDEDIGDNKNDDEKQEEIKTSGEDRSGNNDKEEEITGLQKTSDNEFNRSESDYEGVKKNFNVILKKVNFGDKKFENEDNDENNKKIVPYIKKDNNYTNKTLIFQLPDSTFKNSTHSSYYKSASRRTGDIYKMINHRLYLLPVIIPENYLKNLLLINSSDSKFLTEGEENCTRNDENSNNKNSDYSDSNYSLTMNFNGTYKDEPSSAATFCRKISDTSSKIAEIVNRFENRMALATSTSKIGPFFSEPFNDKYQMEKKNKNFPTKRISFHSRFPLLKQDFNKKLRNKITYVNPRDPNIKQLMSDVMNTKTVTKDSINSLENPNYGTQNNTTAVVALLNNSVSSTEATDRHLMNVINEVLKLFSDTKNQNNRKKNNFNIHKPNSNNLKNNDNSDLPNDYLLKLIKHNYQIQQSNHTSDIKTTNNELNNLRVNPSILVSELEHHEEDKIDSDFTENRDYFSDYKYDDKMSPINEPSLTKSLIIKYENKTLPSPPVIKNDRWYCDNNDHNIKQTGCSDKEYKKNKASDNEITSNSSVKCNYSGQLRDKNSLDNLTNNRTPANTNNTNEWIKFQTSRGYTFMKRQLSSADNPPLGKVCVKGPNELVPEKVAVIFPALLKTVLNEVRPRNIQLILKDDENSISKTQMITVNSNEPTPSTSSLGHESILSQLRSMNETLTKLREDLRKGVIIKSNSTDDTNYRTN